MASITICLIVISSKTELNYITAFFDNFIVKSSSKQILESEVWKIFVCRVMKNRSLIVVLCWLRFVSVSVFLTALYLRWEGKVYQ